MFDTAKAGRVRMHGTIAAVGFASGDRFVLGLWDDGPLGPMNDVMWATADGTRILIAPTQDVADFITAVYSFDKTVISPIQASVEEKRIELRTKRLSLEMKLGDASALFKLRPKALRRWPPYVRLEDILLRRLVGRLLLGGAQGVSAYGVSPSGVREWYCIDDYQPVAWARGTLDGRDLGPHGPLDPPARFGFSEFPRQPAAVRCAPVLEFPGEPPPPSLRGPA